jgi:hypothetical protein
MPNKYSSGKYSIAQCDRCGFRYKLSQLRRLVIKTKSVNILVCPECYELDQPQLSLGLYPVNDPQAVRNPRTDSNSYFESGLSGLQLTNQTGLSTQDTGVPNGGSRMIYWGWEPVGYNDPFGLEVNTLVAVSAVGSVTVTT